MQITKEKTGDLTAVIKIHIEPEDYRPHIEQVVKKYQRTANLPGFRPGKIPAGVVKKMYGKSLLVEELNKLLSNSLYTYLGENNIDFIGSPLPLKSEKEQQFEEGQSFDFSYELGLAPEFNVNVSEADKLPFYIVKVDNDMVDREVGDMRRRFGTYSNPEVSEASNILYGEFDELDETGGVKNGGHKNTTTLALETIKDPIDRNTFVGLKKDSVVNFNPMKLLEDEAEVTALLNLKKDSPSLNSDYRFTVKTINELTKAELNQEFFDKVFGKDVVRDEEDFRAKVKEQIATYFETYSDRKLQKDIKNHLLNKLDLHLPDDFLKRMLRTTMEKKEITDADFEHDYYHTAEDLKWSLIRKKVAKANDIAVHEEEVKSLATAAISRQFAQYGYNSLTDQHLAELTESHLNANEGEYRENYERSILENKVFRALKLQIKLDIEELPFKEFTAKISEKTEHELEHHH